MPAFGRIVRFLRGATANPVEAALYVPEHISMRYEHPAPYEADTSWEACLHDWLGVSWPCPQRNNLDPLWRQIASDLQMQGLRFGRQTYGEYSDAEMSLARAAWCVALHRRPSIVLETGVARGVTSRVVLEALSRNGRGHLWSIDLPHPFDRSLHAQTGAAIPASFRSRWTYVKGSSRRRLPGLLRELGKIDLFIHDSLHTARNTRFEMERTLSVLSPGGIMIVDDIGTHQAFADFVREFPSLKSVVCPHSDRAGSFFGIVQKTA
jgi:predicted O-methyltransferase YrrM